MKQSQLYAPTTKDVSSQAVAMSHILGLKAGLMYQNAAGIYSYLPLATMVLEKITKIVDEELRAIGANKLILPLLEPAELWEKSGRWNEMGDELFKVKDRTNKEYALAPTHEEVVTDLVKNHLNTYKKYPLNVYQVGTKMRDERRPRFGLLRGKEFVMMDGYSFHTDNESLMSTYNDYFKAYERILNRIGVNFRVVEADNGSMGGSQSNEFMALADVGEDTICYLEDSKEAYNLEVCPVYTDTTKNTGSIEEVKLTKTPETSKIVDLVENYSIAVENTIKAICFSTIENEIIMALVAGNHDVNEVKLTNFVNKGELQFASSELLLENNLVEGYIGPYNLDSEVTIIADNAVSKIVCGSVGGNEYGTHYFNVNYDRDLSSIKLADIRVAALGDKLTENSENIKFTRGIEVGHIFALGCKYTDSMKVQYLDKNQKKQTPVMGCYGLGVSRLISAVLEQSHDEKGIIWPKNISPFDIHVIPLDYKKKAEQREFTDKLVLDLKENGFNVLLDDRDERPGVKFTEADLLGFPVQIVVGRKFTEGIVEFKARNSEDKKELEIDELIKEIKNVL